MADLSQFYKSIDEGDYHQAENLLNNLEFNEKEYLLYKTVLLLREQKFDEALENCESRQCKIQFAISYLKLKKVIENTRMFFAKENSREVNNDSRRDYQKLRKFARWEAAGSALSDDVHDDEHADGNGSQ